MAPVRPRLDYLSPLPPVRSGISDYSVDLLPELAREVDLRVVRLPGLPIEDGIEARYRPVPHDETGRDGRLPLYHMGNNHYHAAIAELALERPGVMVLHDLVLHHFLLDRTVGRGEFEPYRAALERDHGWIGDAAARPVRWGAFGRAAQFALPAHRTLLRRQRGVLVHGRWAADMLAEEDPRLAVRRVPMGIPLPAAASRAAGLAFRRARGIAADAPLIGSFGFQTPIKRTEVAIRALAAPGLERVRLLVAGELSPYANYEALAAELGVADRVHVTGFLPFEELDAAIAATDLCLNLRYPTAGETSASLLRILAVGRPVLVSQYAEFGDLPADLATPIPLGDGEQEALVAALAALLLGPPGALAERGERRAPPRRARALARAGRARHRRRRRGARRARAAGRRAGGGGAAQLRRPRPSAGPHRGRGGRGVDAGACAARSPCARPTPALCRWLPSHELPGGVIFEVQLFVDGENRWRGRPWLSLPAALEPGESRRFELALRRPLGPARLLIKPTVQLAEGHRPLGDWAWDGWL